MAGVHKILACIDRYDEQQRLYWNGSAAGWQTSKLWHTTTLDQSTGNWSLSGIDLSVPGNYRVRLYLKDKAGNTDLVTANYFSITTTDTSPLIADVTAPTATTIYPVSTIPPSTSAVIRGSAVDDVSGVEKIRVSLDRYDVDSRNYWQGSTAGWNTAKVWHTATYDAETQTWVLDGVTFQPRENTESGCMYETMRATPIL